MPKLNLSLIYLAQVKEILNQNAHGFEVWAYGSRVDGRSHDASDLDLVLRNPADLHQPIENLSQLKQSFIDSNLPFLVDVMDWACLPVSYREEIKKRHIIV